MIGVEERGGIAVARIEHGRVNALDTELLREIATTMRGLGSAGAIVLTGQGAAFSAGVDLRRVVDGGAAYLGEFLPALNDALLAVFDCPRPVVAAINGHAIAGGCVLACACDVRLMSGGSIGLSELSVGVPFPNAAFEIVRHAAGPAAGELILTARLLDAAGAQARGLVHDIVAAEALLDEATARARALARIPAPVYASTKERLHQPATERIAAGGAAEARALAGWRSPETLASISAFLDRLEARRRAATG
jgi:enoyl-CoA hydratase